MADKFKFQSLVDHFYKTVVKTTDPKSKVGEVEAIFGLYTLIESLKKIEEPRYERMRLVLDQIVKEAKVLAKHKAVKGKPPEKGVKQLIPKAIKIKRAVEKEEKTYERSGAAAGLVEVDISFNAVDFSNTPVGRANLILKVDSNPRPVTLKTSLSGGATRFRGIMIEPAGNANATLMLKRKVANKMSANLSYKSLKSGKTLLISASEDKLEKTVSAGSGAKAAQSVGVKGSVGVDFKVWNGSTELTTTKALEKSVSRSVQYKVAYPKGKLSLSQK